MGSGLPRVGGRNGCASEPVRLLGKADDPSMIAEPSGKDWTAAMKRFGTARAEELKRLNLSGYVFKKDSPSCGMARVKVYSPRGGATRMGSGLFARVVKDALPLMPAEEEGRVKDPVLRENFIERVFAYRRWQQAEAGPKSIRALVEFHTAHKFQLLAHSELHYRALGRLVARGKTAPLDQIYQRYGCAFMEALSVAADAKRHANALEHMIGYFSAALTRRAARAGRGDRDFRRHLTPLIVPVTLIRHYVRKY